MVASRKKTTPRWDLQTSSVSDRKVRRSVQYSHKDGQVSQLLWVVQNFPNAQRGLPAPFVVDEFGADRRSEVNVGKVIEGPG